MDWFFLIIFVQIAGVFIIFLIEEKDDHRYDPYKIDDPLFYPDRGNHNFNPYKKYYDELSYNEDDKTLPIKIGTFILSPVISLLNICKKKLAIRFFISEVNKNNILIYKDYHKNIFKCCFILNNDNYTYWIYHNSIINKINNNYIYYDIKDNLVATKDKYLKAFYTGYNFDIYSIEDLFYILFRQKKIVDDYYKDSSCKVKLANIKLDFFENSNFGDMVKR